MFVQRPANGRDGGLSLVAPRPGEGRLTEPTAGGRPWPRERALMPLTCPSGRGQRMGSLGGEPTFAPDFYAANTGRAVEDLELCKHA